jgi:hypothetical protein
MTKTERIAKSFTTALRDPGRNDLPNYNERRKFKTSCICDRLSELNRRITALASEPQLWLVEVRVRLLEVTQSLVEA